VAAPSHRHHREIFADGAVVPHANMLGEPGDGWRIITDHL
jgi:alkylation response protein AidB-like acyl-CoA dehydrogenase